jgi:hypothetical protein
MSAMVTWMLPVLHQELVLRDLQTRFERWTLSGQRIRPVVFLR